MNISWQRKKILAKLAAKRLYHHAHGREIIHFIHIPRTGGSSIKAALSDHTISKRRAIFLHPHLIRLLDIPKNDQVFFFMRDPITRLISAYNKRKSILASEESIYMDQQEAAALAKFKTLEELVQAMMSRNDQERASAEWAFNHIFFVKDKMTHWLGDVEMVQSKLHQVFFIGRQEKLSHDFEDLRQKLLLPDPCQLPSIKKNASTETGINLDQEALAYMKNYFAEDYRLLHMLQNL